MRHYRTILAAGVLTLWLVAGVPTRAQVAETVRASVMETGGGGGGVSRRQPMLVAAAFVFPGAAGLEASDHQFQKVQGEFLDSTARVFTIDKRPATISREAFDAALTYGAYVGVVRFDDAGLPDRDADPESSVIAWVR